MLLLPLLLKPTFVKKKKGSGCWKPSSIEVTEGFISHVKVYSTANIINYKY